jgi:hypothetical protein
MLSFQREISYISFELGIACVAKINVLVNARVDKIEKIILLFIIILELCLFKSNLIPLASTTSSWAKQHGLAVPIGLVSIEIHGSIHIVLGKFI